MINELKNFIKFAEKGINSIDVSFEKFMSQICSMEEDLNHKLIKRFGKKDIFLTNFGRNFLPYAKKSLHVLEESIKIANEANVYDSDNQLTLGIPRDSASTWAINCIKNFNKMHPGLRLSLIAEDAMTERMKDNSTIIFWCMDDVLPGYDRLWYIEYKYGLYASDDYIKEHGEPTLDSIKDHKFIAYSGNDSANITNWHLFGNYGLPIIKPSVMSQSRDLIVKMTAAGVGIGAICDRQDVYYGYTQMNKVLKTVDGPVIKSYFLVKKGLNEQMRCNVELLSRLFQKYFQEKNINISIL